MLQVFLVVIAVAICYGLVFLAYGKKGIAAKEELGQKLVFPIIIIMLVGIFYALLIGFWNMEAENDWYEYAFLIGAPVCYLLYVLYARNWTKRACAYLEQQRQEELKARREKEERRRQELQQEKEREAAKKQNEELLAQAFSENSGTMTDFAQSVAKCANFREVLSLWDSLHVVDSEASSQIRNEILRNIASERMYGCSSRDIALFSKRLLDIYATTKLELEVKEEVPEEVVPHADTDAVQCFVEKMRNGKKFAEMLSVWETLTLENKTVYEDIHAKLTSEAKAERLYGSSPRELATFLDRLMLNYGPKE